jgi:hypothetical protein
MAWWTRCPRTSNPSAGRRTARRRGLVLSFVAITLPRCRRNQARPSRPKVGGLRHNSRFPVTSGYDSHRHIRGNRDRPQRSHRGRRGQPLLPAEDVQEGFLQPSDTHSVCPWKGEASYYDVVVGEHRNPDAAWYYPAPKDAAKEIADRVAFWKGVTVTG